MARGAAVQTALQHAVGCAQAGRWRECVDGYRSAYVRARRETSGIGAEYRLFCLTGAGSVLQDGSCAAGADDTAFFRKVELDEDEYVACRVEAAFTAGFLFWQLGDREKAGRHYHTVLRLAEGASRAERTRRLVFAATPGGIPGEHPAGVAIDAIAATARDNLRRAGLLRDGCGFEGPAPGLRDAQAAARPGVLHSGGGIAARVTDVPRTASTSIDRMALVDALLNATGGRCCDQCGRVPAAGQKLLLCGRCKLTYYCGADCQKTAWRGGGHKATCRAPSDLREGDFASAFDLKARPDLNGQFCRVIGAAGDDAARWQVTFIGTNETVALKPANVKRCRPPSGPV